VNWLQLSDFRVNSILLMVIMLWAQVGFAMVLLSAAIKGVPGDTLEAARVDGANERQTFFRVVIPQIRTTIITVFVTVTIGVMKVFDYVYVMTNGDFNTNVVGNQFFNELFTNFNNGYAAAIVVLLMIAIIPLMIYQIRQFRAEEATR
jgi:alpha-glucoside transport system permease protein